MSTDLPTDAQWDAFVCREPGGDILQTTPWAEAKRALGFSVGRITLCRNG